MAKQYFDSLDAERAGTIFNIDDPEKIRIVGVDEDVPTEKYPHLYDPSTTTTPDERFVKSFIRRGMRDPVDVWRDPEGVFIAIGGRGRIIDMREVHRRLRKEGAELLPPVRAKRWTAPVNIEKNALAIALDIVDSNLKRKRSAMAIADHVAHLKAMGAKDEQILDAFGWTAKATIDGYLALRDVPAVVREAVERGVFAADVAREFAGMKASEAEAKVQELQAKGITKGSRAKAVVRRNANGAGAARRTRSSKKPKMRSFAEVQERLATLPESGSAAMGARAALQWVLGGEDTAPFAIRLGERRSSAGVEQFGT